MKQRFALVVVSGISLLCCLCHTGGQKKDNIAYVGSTLLQQEDFDAFNTVTRYCPVTPEEFALAARPSISGLVETEALYKKARWDYKNITLRRSLDWKWKERYYISLLYSINVLQPFLGFTESQLKAYYNGHRDEFMGTVQYDSTAKSDSTKKACSTSVVKPFDEVKSTIAEKLFSAAHKPDTGFVRTTGEKDTAVIKSRWVEYIRERAFRDFFMKEYYKDKYGATYPDSLKDVMGEGKTLSQKDMDVILSWIPEYRREQFKQNPQTLFDFAGWLMKWKLFSEKAAGNGYASLPATQNVLKWAWKLELAQRYITEKLATRAKTDVHIDSAMAVYSYWDDNGAPGAAIDTGSWKSHIKRLKDQRASAAFDGLIYQIRKDQRVRFLQTDWRDDKVKDPANLAREADSLRDTGKASEAENIYRILTNDFIFTKEGTRALVELAKIQTEQQSYNEAIRNYRRFLVSDADPEKQCNHMFMIGFIYDEYLDKPELAEINYKWVLKNAPDCGLADDAEFMMLHLGEQMSSVEELQAEVKRQGKKVEDQAQSDTTGLTVEATPSSDEKK